jgi:hypothetical protein
VNVSGRRQPFLRLAAPAEKKQMEEELSWTSAVMHTTGEVSRPGAQRSGDAGELRRRRAVDVWGIKNEDDRIQHCCLHRTLHVQKIGLNDA